MRKIKHTQEEDFAFVQIQYFSVLIHRHVYFVKFLTPFLLVLVVVTKIMM